MKKIVFIAVSLFLFVSAKAQDYNGIVKANPIGFAYSFNVTYEKPINDGGSAFARLRYYYLQMEYSLGSSKFTVPPGAISLKAGYRFYLSGSKVAPNGFFLSPTADMYLYKSVTLFGVGGELGYQWAWDSGFVLDLYTGSDIMLGTRTFAVPVGGVGLGFAF